jgi:hypothetical protein
MEARRSRLRVLSRTNTCQAAVEARRRWVKLQWPKLHSPNEQRTLREDSKNCLTGGLTHCPRPTHANFATPSVQSAERQQSCYTRRPLDAVSHELAKRQAQHRSLSDLLRVDRWGPQQHGLALAMTHSQWINNLGWMWRYVATAEAEVCARRTGGGGDIDEREGGKGKTTKSLGRKKSV